MKITIDAKGNISPPGSAIFVTMKPAIGTAGEGQDLPDSDIGIYLCSPCNTEFEAARGKVTTHECEPPKRRRLAQVI